MLSQEVFIGRDRCTVRIVGRPTRAVLGRFQVEFGVHLGDTEMGELCDRKGSAADKAVGGRSSPTGFDRQASHPEAKSDEQADDIRSAMVETVRFFAVDRDRSELARRLSRNADEHRKKPADTG